MVISRTSSLGSNLWPLLQGQLRGQRSRKCILATYSKNSHCYMLQTLPHASTIKCLVWLWSAASCDLYFEVKWGVKGKNWLTCAYSSFSNGSTAFTSYISYSKVDRAIPNMYTDLNYDLSFKVNLGYKGQNQLLATYSFDFLPLYTVPHANMHWYEPHLCSFRRYIISLWLWQIVSARDRPWSLDWVCHQLVTLLIPSLDWAYTALSA